MQYQMYTWFQSAKAGFLDPSVDRMPPGCARMFGMPDAVAVSEIVSCMPEGRQPHQDWERSKISSERPLVVFTAASLIRIRGAVAIPHIHGWHCWLRCHLPFTQDQTTKRMAPELGASAEPRTQHVGGCPVGELAARVWQELASVHIQPPGINAQIEPRKQSLTGSVSEDIQYGNCAARV